MRFHLLRLGSRSHTLGCENRLSVGRDTAQNLLVVSWYRGQLWRTHVHVGAGSPGRALVGFHGHLAGMNVGEPFRAPSPTRAVGTWCLLDHGSEYGFRRHLWRSNLIIPSGENGSKRNWTTVQDYHPGGLRIRVILTRRFLVLGSLANSL